MALWQVWLAQLDQCDTATANNADARRLRSAVRANRDAPFANIEEKHIGITSAAIIYRNLVKHCVIH